MKLSEMFVEANGHINRVLAIKIDSDPTIYEYRFPYISPSKKYCNWGKQPGAHGNIGDWIEVDRIEVVEILE